MLELKSNFKGLQEKDKSIGQYLTLLFYMKRSLSVMDELLSKRNNKLWQQRFYGSKLSSSDQ